MGQVGENCVVVILFGCLTSNYKLCLPPSRVSDKCPKLSCSIVHRILRLPGGLDDGEAATGIFIVIDILVVLVDNLVKVRIPILTTSSTIMMGVAATTLPSLPSSPSSSSSSLF